MHACKNLYSTTHKSKKGFGMQGMVIYKLKVKQTGNNESNKCLTATQPWPSIMLVHFNDNFYNAVTVGNGVSYKKKAIGWQPEW